MPSNNCLIIFSISTIITSIILYHYLHSISKENNRPHFNYNRALTALQYSTFTPDFSPINVDVVIPLGPDCWTAWHIKRGGWRTTPYPFDWTLFENRSTHISTVSNLFDTDFHSLFHLQSKSFIQQNYTLNNGTKVLVSLHPQLDIRWIHDNPKADPSKVIERIRILKHRLDNAKDVQVLFVMGWRSFTHPKSIDLFSKQITRLFSSIDGRLGEDANYKLLLVFEIAPQHPKYIQMKEILSEIDRTRIIIVPILPSPSEEWGSDLGWDLLMRRFQVPSSENDVESCLAKYFKHGQLSQEGFDICVGSRTSQTFDELDENVDKSLSLKEFSKVNIEQ